VLNLIKSADLDSDGLIDFDEFRSICLSAEANGTSGAFVAATFGAGFFTARELIATKNFINSSLEPSTIIAR
jgi:hypothetical protein